MMMIISNMIWTSLSLDDANDAGTDDDGADLVVQATFLSTTHFCLCSLAVSKLVWLKGLWVLITRIKSLFVDFRKKDVQSWVEEWVWETSKGREKYRDEVREAKI